MSDMLSQAEIEALLGDADTSDVSASSESSVPQDIFTNEQKDILGEVGNITMGTAATTLFALLNQKVLITTPNVLMLNWRQLSDRYDRPCVGVRVDYKFGLQGTNVLVLKERDVRIISSLMMGGDGIVPDDGKLTELDLSAIGEAMNQMVGSAATSLSGMIQRTIDIDTPQAFVLEFDDDDLFFDTVGYSPDDTIVCIAFKMEIGTLINSELVQVFPFNFAMDVIETMSEVSKAQNEKTESIQTATSPNSTSATQAPAPPSASSAQAPAAEAEASVPAGMNPQTSYQPSYQNPQQTAQNVNVQPVTFQNFDQGALMQQKENIDIIMDVPLEVSVELGRTRKKIKEILEFSPGSVIELDKLAGEPIDILVNGKFVAKGEVVVIDENFGIRVTDIISVDKRI
ncbi:MAG: flagellar motor switch phosphatase FliY [Clostridiales bacterium]|jgi:flagellar motor switch protein FliN/FliY|nr:flagellar motor switch phosphatase FliY [Clostridiales bacterium]